LFADHLRLAAGLYAWADWHRNAAVIRDRKARGLW
jgi:hypothetical protein